MTDKRSETLVQKSVSEWSDVDVSEYVRSCGKDTEDDAERLMDMGMDGACLIANASNLGTFLAGSAIVHREKIQRILLKLLSSSSSSSSQTFSASMTILLSLKTTMSHPFQNLLDTFEKTQIYLDEAAYGGSAEVTRRWANLNVLNYDDRLTEGIKAGYPVFEETVVVDLVNPRGRNLIKLIEAASPVMAIYHTSENRAIALASLATRFLGCPSSKHCSEQFTAFMNRWRSAHRKMYDQTYHIYLDDLISVGGLERHWAILYKLLADATVSPPPQLIRDATQQSVSLPFPDRDSSSWTTTKQLSGVNNRTDSVNNNRVQPASVACKLVRRSLDGHNNRTDVMVRIDDVEYFVDMYQTPPRLLREDTMEAKAYYLSHGNSSSHAKAKRVMFRDLLRSKVDHFPFQFGTLLNDSAVVVRFANPSVRVYDIAAFIDEMDALASVVHPSIVGIRAICLSSKAMASIPRSGASLSEELGFPKEEFYYDGAKQVPVPLFACVRYPIEAQPLADVLSQNRQKWTVHRILNVATQLAEALVELHMLGIVMREDLNPHRLLITPVGDIRVGDVFPDRYALDPPPVLPPNSLRYTAPEHFPPSSSSSPNTTSSLATLVTQKSKISGPKRRAKKSTATKTNLAQATTPATDRTPDPTTSTAASAVTVATTQKNETPAALVTEPQKNEASIPDSLSKEPVRKGGSTRGDIYAFGCVIYAVASGHHRWAELPEGTVRERALKGEDPPAFLDINVKLYELIQRCCRVVSHERPSLQYILIKLRELVKSADASSAESSTRSVFSCEPSPAIASSPPKPTFATTSESHLRDQLQPLSSDSVTAAREKWLTAMGTVDPYIIVAKRVDAPSFFVVHRPNGNAVFISCGLWDPSASTSASATTDCNGDSASAADAALPDIELVAEAKESELGGDLSNCWLYQCILEVSCTAKRNYTRLRRLLKERKYATMEVLDVRVLPPDFTDPSTGRACMLLGVDTCPTLPQNFNTPTVGVAVQLVTARLLTLSQWRDSQEFAVGKRPLALRFQRDGTHHCSSLITAQRSAGKRNNATDGDASLALAVGGGGSAPLKYVRTGDGDRVAPQSTDVPPDGSWTVLRLIDRVVVAVQIDATSKAKPPTRITVPTLIPASKSVNKSAAKNVSTFAATVGAATLTPAQIKAIPTTARTISSGHTTSASNTNTTNTNDTKNNTTTPMPTGATPSKSVTPASIFLATLSASLDSFQTLTPIADYDPPISSGVFVHSFESNDVGLVLREIAIEIRRILAPNSVASEFTRTAAQTVYGAIGTQSQLYGWQHVSEFIRNPTLYIERTKTLAASSTSAVPSTAPSAGAANGTAGPDPSSWPARGPSELHEAIDLLQETGHSIVKRLIQRVDWMRAVFRRENVMINPAFFVECVATDTKWVEDATAFMKACEERVAELLAKNPQRFNHFRELQKKGVQWPHSPDVRREIERAAFTFRPMMIKRDRCVCDVCGVEMSGWRSWYEPRAFHDYSRHPPSFRAAMYPPEQQPNNDTDPPVTVAATTATAAAASAQTTQSLRPK